MGRLEGKVAVITGSGSGLGAEAARLFASEGAAVVVSDLAEEGGRKVVEEIRAAGGRAELILADVRESASVLALYAGAKAAFGLVNVLYNNAGISPADDDASAMGGGGSVTLMEACTEPMPPHPAACICAILCSSGNDAAFSPSARSCTMESGGESATRSAESNTNPRNLRGLLDLTPLFRTKTRAILRGLASLR